MNAETSSKTEMASGSMPYDDLSTWGEVKVAQRVDARPRAAGLRDCKGFPSNPKW